MTISDKMDFARRDFLKTSLIGCGSAAVANRCLSAEAESATMLHQQLDVPVAGCFDVIVAGSGPAGIATALSAARQGAKTLLLEKNGCLGGIWTAGLLCWILDVNNKQGILAEICERLDVMHAGFANRGGNGAYAYDPEAMKFLLEQMCGEDRVTVRLGTWVVDGAKQGDRITHVVTESKSGRQAWKAKIFVDCTGDGDLAARVGCGFDLGEEQTHVTQPMSLLALVGGVSLEKIKPFVRTSSGSPSKRLLRAEIERGGVDLTYKHPGLYPIYDDLYMMMANHQYEANALNADDITRATIQARREVNEIVNGLRSLGDPWSNLRLIATAEQIGVREARRIHGLYQVTADDLVKGVRHDDAVCRVTFGVDVHSTSKTQDVHGKGYSRGIHSKPYDIPLRALIAKDVRGLMMAGRCISGDFIAHSSYRVTGNAVVMGETAGKVAAQSVAKNVLPESAAG